MTSVVAGLAFALASCGGGDKKTEEQTPATPEQKPAAAAPAAPAPTAARQTHDVNLVLDGSSYKYVPDALVIRSGDLVRFRNKSGGPHNVSFWPDSIPRGAAGALQAGMPSQMAPLQGPLLGRRFLPRLLLFSRHCPGHSHSHHQPGQRIHAIMHLAIDHPDGQQHRGNQEN